MVGQKLERVEEQHDEEIWLMYEQLRPNIDGGDGDEGETESQVEVSGAKSAERTALAFTFVASA